MDKKNYKHIFFDLDRTLWDFDANSRTTLEEIFETHLKYYDFTFEEFYKTYVEFNSFFWSEYRKGKVKKEELRYIRFDKALEKLGVWDQDLGMILGSDYVKISPFKKKLIPGTVETLDYLANKNYILHIITNGFHEVQGIKLKNSGLVDYFDQVVISEMTGYKKPDPRVFQHALNASKTDAKSSIMVGDDLDADILGAKNAGWDQIYYNPKNINHGHELTKEIKELNEIKLFL